MNIELETNLELRDYQPIFFDRPVSNLRKKNIAVLVGSNTNLFEIQQVYMIILAMNHNPVLIVDEGLKELGLPADLYLSNRNKLTYINSDEAIARIGDCHGLIAGIGLELNSSMQLLLDRLIKSYRGLIVLTETSFKLPGINESLASNMLLYGSTKRLLSLGLNKTNHLSNSGLLRKLELLHSFVEKYGGGLVCVEKFQILSLDKFGDSAGVINSDKPIGETAFLATLISLLADRDVPLALGWQKYFLASGYLYKHYYQIKRNPIKIKDFLQNQF